MEKHITLPLTEELARSLKAGDVVRKGANIVVVSINVLQLARTFPGWKFCNIVVGKHKVCHIHKCGKALNI